MIVEMASLLAGLAPTHDLRLFSAALSDATAHPFKKKSPDADAALNSAVAGFGAAAEISDSERCHADCAISLETKLGGLYFSPEW